MYKPILKKEDYMERIGAMARKAEEKGLDAVLIFANEAEPANVRYFTNYRPIFESTAIVISRSGEAVLLIGPETDELAKDHSVLPDYKKLLEFRESSDPDYPDIKIDTFEDVFTGLNGGNTVSRLGLIGTNIMTVQVYEGILRSLSDAELSKEDDLLRELRMIKSPRELEVLKRAAEIAGKGFEYALERIEPGMTELQAVAHCIAGVYQNGAEGTGFPVWCLSGKGTNQAIGIPTQKVIGKNEVVQISMGVMLEGYVSSFGRPFVFGEISDEIRRMMDTALEANALTHKLLAPGVNASEVASKVHGLVRERGLGDCIVYGPAHGIGMMECEFPFIETTSDIDLQQGMTFAADTYLAGENFGMRFEDTVAITADGEEQYCDYRREVIQL